jgi:hypothetical protein
MRLCKLHQRSQTGDISQEASEIVRHGIVRYPRSHKADILPVDTAEAVRV